MTIDVANKIAAKLLPDAQKWIRRSSARLDDEIQQTVAACLLDMKNAGIVNIQAEDPLILQAAKMYLRSTFEYGDHPERWGASYEHLKAALSLNSDYTKRKETADGSEE